jgi:hypothetical protein
MSEADGDTLPVECGLWDLPAAPPPTGSVPLAPIAEGSVVQYVQHLPIDREPHLLLGLVHDGRVVPWVHPSRDWQLSAAGYPLDSLEILAVWPPNDEETR